MDNLFECFLKLIESPYIDKPYRDIAKIYRQNKNEDFAAAFETLIERNDRNNAPGEEPPERDKE